MIRRYGPPPDYRRHVARPGAYAVILSGRDVLVTLQEAPRRELQLPGGGIDPGESPLRALHREVREETGWTISAPRRLGAFRRFVWMPEYRIHAEKICTVYVARAGLRIGPPSEPDHRALWLGVEEAVAHLGNAGDAAFLAAAVTPDAPPGSPTGRPVSRRRRRGRSIPS